jgi:3-oxoadipate enol-lactonase
MAIAKLPGVDISYRLEGRPDLPILALSNSLGTDSGMWDKQIPALTERYRVLRHDTRGHGSSSVPKPPYTIDEMAKDLLALCDHLGFEHINFCGLSLGGLVGQHIGIHYGHRLTKLVVCNTASALPPKENWDARIAAVTTKGMDAIVDLAMQRFFSDAWRARNEPILGTMRTTFLATDPQGYAGACAAIGATDYTPDLGKISAPTLVIGGSLDASTPPAMGADVLAAKINGAKKVILDAAHISCVEQPEAFNKAVLEFLA